MKVTTWWALPPSEELGIHSVQLRRQPGGHVELVVNDAAIVAQLEPSMARRTGEWLLADEEGQ